MNIRNLFAFVVLFVLAGACSTGADSVATDDFAASGLQRPTACPACGESQFTRIVYGLPTLDITQEIKAGRAVNRGCEVSPGQPTWLCRCCAHEWFDATDPNWLAGENELRQMLGMPAFDVDR